MNALCIVGHVTVFGINQSKPIKLLFKSNYHIPVINEMILIKLQKRWAVSVGFFFLVVGDA